MDIIGIIAEYNPFHNGHLYHIKEIKKRYPNSLLILVLNGYFLERGEVSLLTKEDKVKLSLANDIDLVVELPFVYGTESADYFSYYSIKALDMLGCNKLIFGSESNDIDTILKIVDKQTSNDYQAKVEAYLQTGLNYPTSLAKALEMDQDFFKPNDLLGISYVKAIKKLNSKIIPETIKRTNSYHDIISNDEIISAENIRNKLKNNEDIKKFLPKDSLDLVKSINEANFFKLIKAKIITENDLSIYLDVDEGIEFRLKKYIDGASSLEEYINLIKTKRYTYNKIQRMLIHILIGLTKADKDSLNDNYLRILGFSELGKNHLKKINFKIPNVKNTLIYNYELKASKIYDLIMDTNTFQYEIKNCPIKK